MRTKCKLPSSLQENGALAPFYCKLICRVLADFYVKFNFLSNARNFKSLSLILRELRRFCRNTLMCGRKKMIFWVKNDP